MQIYFSPIDGSNLARAAQLCQKTNQFNTTTKRYSADDLVTKQESGSDVVVVGLSDKFSDYEDIGLIILTPEQTKSMTVDLMLLSCRVLGRGLEKMILNWSINRAKQKGYESLVGVIHETERNTPVRSVFADNGFEKITENDNWINTLSKLEKIDWFGVHDKFELGC